MTPEGRLRGGFTLVEIMVALAVGMILLNAAFSLLTYTQRFIQRIERLGLRNEVLTGQIRWVMSGGGTSYPEAIQSGLTAGFTGPVGVSPYRILSLAAKTYQKNQPATWPLDYGAVIYLPAVY